MRLQVQAESAPSNDTTTGQLLNDLFGDRRVPRDERARIPVVLSGGEIAWVPGVATGEAFKVTAATGRRVSLRWTR